MKIQTVHIQNFKNIKDLKHDLAGKNILLLADNEKGKSSFMQAIQIALGSANYPHNSITDGEDSGSINVVTDDEGNEYKFEVKLKKGQKPAVTVYAPNGIRDNRKSVIGSICGQIDFDINHFVTLSETTSGRKKQVEIVKSFLDEDTKGHLRSHELKIEQDYEERSDLNKEAKALKGWIDESGLTKEDLITYQEPIDITELQTTYTESVELNSTIDGVEERRGERITEIDEKETELKALEDHIKDIKAKKMKADAYLKQNKRVDVTEIKGRLDTSQGHNLKHSKVKDLKDKIAQHKDLEERSGEFTALIESSRQAVADAIRDMDGPVEGLTFDEERLYYQGQAVESNTLATSAIMHLGIKLQMAKNPGAKVLFIERGESLGLDRLKEIQTIADKNGYQLIMEQVERGTEKLTIEIMPKY